MFDLFLIELGSLLGRFWNDFGDILVSCIGSQAQSTMGKPRKVDSNKKKNVEKPQDGRQKSCQNIGNLYQMEDNKAAPSAPPQGGGASRHPLGVLVVFHLVSMSYVLD